MRRALEVEESETTINMTMNLHGIYELGRA